MVDINTLRRQVPTTGAQYRQPALAVLTQEQKAKLPALEAALKAQGPAYEAIQLNLMDYPNQQIGLPRPLPALGGPAAEPASLRFGGRR